MDLHTTTYTAPHAAAPQAPASSHALNVLHHAEPISVGGGHSKQFGCAFTVAVVILLVMQPPFVTSESGRLRLDNVIMWAFITATLSFIVS